MRKDNSIFIQLKPVNCQPGNNLTGPEVSPAQCGSGGDTATSAASRSPELCMGIPPAPAVGGFDGGQRVALNSH